jgi:hypothetical protein
MAETPFGRELSGFVGFHLRELRGGATWTEPEAGMHTRLREEWLRTLRDFDLTPPENVHLVRRRLLMRS